MRKITIFISEIIPLSSLAMPLDVFMAAGVFWNMLCGQALAPLFETKTVTIDGHPIRTVDGLEIKPDASIDDVHDSETIIVTPVADPINDSSDDAVPWLKNAHEKGAHLASICTGAFLLAKTGLLNDKNDDLSVDLLSQRAKMSRRAFERRFKMATGDSPLRYIQRVRIENAKRLLEKGHNTFDEITYLVGYADSSTFSRIFKKNTGLTPRLYKKKYRL